VTDAQRRAGTVPNPHPPWGSDPVRIRRRPGKDPAGIGAVPAPTRLFERVAAAGISA